MMPDLGRYAVTILGAYGVTTALLGGLIGLSLWRNNRVRRALEKAEAEMRGQGRG
jgi:heme exporter protein D